MNYYPEYNTNEIREPIVDGIFYPENKEELEVKITRLLEQTKKYKGSAFGIISPHAGLEYSGQIMAAAYQSAANRKIKTIVILAPVHREPLDNIILPESNQFKTPLGVMKVNQKYIEELISCGTRIVRDEIPHLEEHCIEIQLPFLQILFPDADIIPILIGKTKPGNIKLLSNALQLIFAEHYETTLFVSTANIATSYIQKNSQKEAEKFINLIKEVNIQGIIEAKSQKKISSCGWMCAATILSFANMNYKVDVLMNSSSEKINSGSNNIVHYAAISLNTPLLNSHRS